MIAIADLLVGKDGSEEGQSEPEVPAKRARKGAE